MSRPSHFGIQVSCPVLFPMIHLKASQKSQQLMGLYRMKVDQHLRIHIQYYMPSYWRTTTRCSQGSTISLLYPHHRFVIKMAVRTPTLGLLFVALSYSWLCGYNSFSGCSQFLNDTHHLNNQQKNFKSSDVSFNLSTGVYSGRCTFLRRRFSKGRVLYTTNCSSSFNPILLTITLSGDVHPQPRLGPENNNMRPKKAQQRSTRNVTVAHLNVRSIRSRENFYLLADDNRQLPRHIDSLWVLARPIYWWFWLANPWILLFLQDHGGSLVGGLWVCIKDIYSAFVTGNLSNISENSFPQLWLNVNCKKLKPFLLCTVYRPPNSPVSFLETLSESFMDSLLVGSEVLILGDLNCKVLEDCYEGRALTGFCSTFNLTQLVESPTRVTETSKSVIDIVLTTNKDFVENCVVKS